MTAAEQLATGPHDAPEPAAPGPTEFAAYAVRSRSGPHVTMQAGVVHADRFWTTTAGSSLKARSVRSHRRSAVVVREGDADRVIAGRTSRLRPFRPLDALKDPFAPLRSTSAVVRLGLGQVEQLIGYFEAGGRVPADWLPHRRVLLVTRIDRSLTLDGLDVVAAHGAWDAAGGPLEPRPGERADLPHDALPGPHTDIVRRDRRAHVGLVTPDGPVVLPATWTGGNGFAVSAGAVEAISGQLPGRGVAVFDESDSRRPDEKLGVMFRGSVSLAAVDGPVATVLVHSDRVTTWDGFEARTVPVG